jgi:hypothetical protein
MRGTENRAKAGDSPMSTTFSRAAIGVIVLACAGAITAPRTAAAGQDYPGRQQPPSLGEIARQLRAEKQPMKESAQVWTNENIPTNPFAISVVGKPPPPPPAPEPVAGADAAKPQTKLETDLDKAKEELAGLEKELDLAKRDLALQQQSFLTNPLSSQDVAGQSKLTDAQTAIDARVAEVERAKARVADLQQKVDEQKKVSPGASTDTNTPRN